MHKKPNIDLDSLYGKESLPSTHSDAHQDFKAFKAIGWLKETDKSAFLRKATEHINKNGSQKMEIKKLNDLGLAAVIQWINEYHRNGSSILCNDQALALWCDDLETDDCNAEIRARDSVTGQPVTLSLPPECYEILHLTLDPVGLEQGVFTVMRGTDAICILDLNWYPEELRENEYVQYDALCDSVDPRVTHGK